MPRMKDGAQLLSVVASQREEPIQKKSRGVEAKATLSPGSRG